MNIRFTAKQMEILSVIKTGNADGTLCTAYDIMEKLSYEVKRDALLHSMRILVENDLVERRDGGRSPKGQPLRVFCLTTKAAEMV